MTTLAKTQYELNWLGTMPKYNYTMEHPAGMLAESEEELWSSLDELVLAGWVVLSTEMVVHN